MNGKHTFSSDLSVFVKCRTVLCWFFFSVYISCRFFFHRSIRSYWLHHKHVSRLKMEQKPNSLEITCWSTTHSIVRAYDLFICFFLLSPCLSLSLCSWLACIFVLAFVKYHFEHTCEQNEYMEKKPSTKKETKNRINSTMKKIGKLKICTHTQCYWTLKKTLTSEWTKYPPNICLSVRFSLFCFLFFSLLFFGFFFTISYVVIYCVASKLLSSNHRMQCSKHTQSRID